MRNVSELRRDLVTGDWVVVATGRAKRPYAFARTGAIERPQPKAGCPFERLPPEALLVYTRAGEGYRLTPEERSHLERDWWLAVVPNKYPAFRPGACPIVIPRGPYRWQAGVGFHEVVVTRDHHRSLAAMKPKEAAMVVLAYRDRYLALKDEGCVKYIAMFHNHGREAGATISHPHSQIIAIPVIPPDVGRSLAGSADYYRRHRRCVHCVMISFERRRGQRVIYENASFIAFCPYVSRQAFEVRIFPKRHQPEFECMSDSDAASVAEVLSVSLAKLAGGLKDPAYNFFIHTAPVAGGRSAPHYHWHIEILPKTAVWAGFEIATGIEISPISPEAAAKFLRAVKVWGGAGSAPYRS